LFVRRSSGIRQQQRGPNRFNTAANCACSSGIADRLQIYRRPSAHIGIVGSTTFHEGAAS
jgi:hypothetical protein